MGLPFPSPGDLPDPGIEPGSPASQADALPSEPPGKPHGRRNLANMIKGLDLEMRSLSWIVWAGPMSS